MTVQQVFDLVGRDVLAADAEEAADTVDEFEGAVGAAPGGVAGVEPAIGEGAGVGFGLVEVFACSIKWGKRGLKTSSPVCADSGWDVAGEHDIGVQQGDGTAHEAFGQLGVTADTEQAACVGGGADGVGGGAAIEVGWGCRRHRGIRRSGRRSRGRFRFGRSRR